MLTYQPEQPALGAAGRWELLRALGALTIGPPAATRRVASALGLPELTPAEHTDVFVLSLPPYGSIHVGSDGKLGGEAADRVAGLWRALGLSPPADADHLAAILALYAELGEAASVASRRPVRERLARARDAVLWEHLWPWVPGYLDAVAVEAAAARPWAELTLRALTAGARVSRPSGRLPLALRAAPGPITADLHPGDLLDALTTRVRTGFILTHADISAAARALGLGLRRGERKFAVKAFFEQEPGPTLAWLAGHAEAWACRHQRHLDVAATPGQWWTRRAASSARCLATLAASA